MDVADHSDRSFLLRVVQQHGALGGHGQDHAAPEGEGPGGPSGPRRVRAGGPAGHQRRLPARQHARGPEGRRVETLL